MGEAEWYDYDIDDEERNDPDCINKMPDWAKDIFNRIERMLRIAKIELKILKVADTGSCYCYFENKQYLGKLRIANHREREKYGYRWQVRTDINKPKVVENKGHKQYFYDQNNLHELVNHIINYNRKALSNQSA